MLETVTERLASTLDDEFDAALDEVSTVVIVASILEDELDRLSDEA